MTEPSEEALVPSARTAAAVLAIALLASACSADEILTLTPPQLELVEQREALPSVVLDADGNVLTTLQREYRERVALDDVAPHLVDAVLAAEDHRFWDHGGVDGRALVRAAARNLAAGEVVEGGSTISQQLVELRFQPPTEDTVATKALEAALALQLEEEYDKEWILEEYLNTVYLGGGAHGIGAAAWSYFRRDVADLTLAQSALLAGLIRRPGTTDPRVDPIAARERRDTVLRLMLEDGSIDQTAATAAMATPVTVREAPLTPSPVEPHVVDHVLRTLVQEPILGPDEGARWNELTGGGLTIHTTIDPDAQATARAVLAARLDGADDPDAAIVTLDTATGAVLASVGSVPYEELQFDLALQGARQPGSVFKGMTLAAAVADGYTASDRVDARGGTLRTDHGPWRVRASGRSQATLSTAIRWSDNGAFARLGLELGVERVAATAQALGITSELGDQPAMLLGGTEACCTVVEMATAYATIAALGTRHDPHLVDRIEDRDGNVVWQAPTQGRLVLDEVAAFETVELLRQVVLSGTGQAAQVDGHDVIGKTGTTTDNVDGWFVGATPELTTAVWVGHHDARRTARVDGRRLQGGGPPAQIFAAHMTALLGPGPGPTFELPEHRIVELEVDVETGLRPAPWCPETEVRTFADTRTPTETCPSPAPPAPSPSPSPSPTATPLPDGPSPSPGTSPTPEPSTTPAPPPSPEPSPEPSPPAESPAPTPSESPTPTPEPSATPSPNL